MTTLRTALDARLAALRADLATGRAQLAHLQEVLPRIEGAIAVLEELAQTDAEAARMPQDAPGEPDVSAAGLDGAVAPGPSQERS